MYESLYQMQSGVYSRWASAENPDAMPASGGKARNGRKGSAWFTLEAGQTAVLAYAENTSGIIRRIWMTINRQEPKFLRGVVMEIFWDGKEKPAVSAPIGDFFCHGPGRMAVFENLFFSSPEGRSFNCCVPMPFRTGMRVQVKNESDEAVKYFYYDVDFTIGDYFSESTLYFHSFFNRENPTRMRRDFELLPHINGSGRFLGVNLGIRCNMDRYFSAWWGEGEVKVYLDGDRDYPTLCGTGVEDYVSTAWGQDYYCNQYHGSQLYDKEKMEIGCYRLHIPDPIYFHKSIRITIQQIGGIDTDDELNKAKMQFNVDTGKYTYTSVNGNIIDFTAIDPKIVRPELFEREDDWSCCTYFYYNSPVSDLPEYNVQQGLI